MGIDTQNNLNCLETLKLTDMPKIIESRQENLIECDNPRCGYVIKNLDPENPGDGKHYINKPCPKCFENLLTEEDYLLSRKVERMISIVNICFGWLAYIFPVNRDKSTDLKVHKGIKIS